ncbi:MAG: type II toxin-antitoxin system VapC family toxin [Opitutaceae bacterium]|nr:type II toxin-antitoxin system VapC family toxin [Opitutaceae bacterium]
MKKTAIDTSILLDVLLPDPVHWQGSAAALKVARDAGPLVICELVYAELATEFWTTHELYEELRQTGIKLEFLDARSAFRAGRLWKEYRLRGGPRSRIMTDFLIGTHALLQTDRLLTRDGGFYRDYFKGLTVFYSAARL